MFGRRLLSNLLWNKICQFKIRTSETRFVHGIGHDLKRSIFFVKFTDTYDKAILTYRKNGRILDFLTIFVPDEHQGEGLGQRLAEAAFTYAIVNDYHMYLSCVYLQKYYLAIKNPDLEELVVGPPHVLEGPYSETPDPASTFEIPDPEDFMIYTPKS